jgi:hypothetical protein
MRSDKLIQLDRPTPPSRDTREAEHKRVQAQVDEYLAAGGGIHQVDPSENHYSRQPIKRDRRAQVNFMRRWNKIT